MSVRALWIISHEKGEHVSMRFTRYRHVRGNLCRNPVYNCVFGQFSHSHTVFRILKSPPPRTQEVCYCWAPCEEPRRFLLRSSPRRLQCAAAAARRARAFRLGQVLRGPPRWLPTSSAITSRGAVRGRSWKGNTLASVGNLPGASYPSVPAHSGCPRWATASPCQPAVGLPGPNALGRSADFSPWLWGEAW